MLVNGQPEIRYRNALELRLAEADGAVSFWTDRIMDCTDAARRNLSQRGAYAEWIAQAWQARRHHQGIVRALRLLVAQQRAAGKLSAAAE